MRKKIGFFVAIVLTGYFVVSFALHGIASYEVFPFYNWKLFPAIPSEEQTMYRIVVRSVNQEPLDSPVLLSESNNNLIKDDKLQRSIHSLVEEFANALTSDREDSIHRTRKVIESIIPHSSMKYDVVAINADVYEMWDIVFAKNKRSAPMDDINFDVLGSFEFRK